MMAVSQSLKGAVGWHARAVTYISVVLPSPLSPTTIMVNAEPRFATMCTQEETERRNQRHHLALVPLLSSVANSSHD